MKKVNFNYLIDKFDCFIFDQWGVLHDGKYKFSFVDKTLLNLKSKVSIILSNTSQNFDETIIQTLNKLNINKNFFLKIVTSGDYLEYIAKSKEKKYLIFKNTLKKKKCFIISNGRKSRIVKNLGLKKAKLENAKFILALSIKPNLNLDSLKIKLRKLKKKNLVMICTNPDINVFDGKAKRFTYQVGTLGDYYSKIGGRVHYIGKPFKDIYQHALKSLKIKKSKILMVGDSVATDIKGAKNYGIKSALVIDGFKKNEFNKYKYKNINQVLRILKPKPDYIIKNISI